MWSVKVASKQGGLGLVELLVGIVISLIVMAGTIYVFIGNSESGLLHMRSTRMTQQLRDTMDRMVQDIRRGGYLGYRYLAAAPEVLPGDNPFNKYDPTLTTAVTGLDCTDVSGTWLCAGIMYSYNLDDDGGALSGSIRERPTVGEGAGGAGCGADFDTDNIELFGFRFNRTDGIVEMSTVVDDCTNNPSSWTTWTPITDPNLLRVGDLGTSAEDRVGFVISEECVGLIDRAGPGGSPPDGDVFVERANPTTALNCADMPVLDPGAVSGTGPLGDVVVKARRVRIQLAGRLVRDPAVTVKLNEVVDLPNHAACVVSATQTCL